MDYRQLQAFTVLAEELHFGRAAQRLHITQPALTQQIKSFENALELRLFTRDRRNVALTAEGQFLLAEARMILGHCDKFRENARSLRQGRKGQLKIGYVGSAIFDPALSVLIGNYRQRKPEADLLIEEHNVNDLITGLLSETVDWRLFARQGRNMMNWSCWILRPGRWWRWYLAIIRSPAGALFHSRRWRKRRFLFSKIRAASDWVGQPSAPVGRRVLRPVRFSTRVMSPRR